MDTEPHAWVKAIGWRRAGFSPIFLLILSMPWIAGTGTCRGSRPLPREASGWDVGGGLMVMVLVAIVIASALAAWSRRTAALAALADVLAGGWAASLALTLRGHETLVAIYAGLCAWLFWAHALARLLGKGGRSWRAVISLAVIAPLLISTIESGVVGLFFAATVGIEAWLYWRADYSDRMRLVLAWHQLGLALTFVALVVVLPGFLALIFAGQDLGGYRLGATFALLYLLAALAELGVLVRQKRPSDPDDFSTAPSAQL